MRNAAWKSIAGLILLAAAMPGQYGRSPYGGGGYGGGGYGGGGYGGGGMRTSRGPRGPAPGGIANEPLAAFTGVVRNSSSKTLLIQEAEADTLEFRCSKKTDYFDGEKKVKASVLEPGDKVAVDARHTVDGKLEAVVVRLNRKAQPETLNQRPPQ